MKKLTTGKIKKKQQYYNNEFFAKWAGFYDYEKYIPSPLRKKAAQIVVLNNAKSGKQKK